MKDIKLIVFDLGGVLVKLGKTPFPTEWNFKKELTLKHWIQNENAREFEKGNINIEKFTSEMISEHELSVKKEDIVREFSNWIKGLYPNVIETTKELRKNYKLAILSNTNEIHWPILMKKFRLEDNFDYYFASHLVHLAKPDEKIYEHVIEKTKIDAENILFFDDNTDNINSANNIGINAIQVNGFKSVKDYLITNSYL